MIPKIVHQTWKTDTIPEKWARPYARCRNVLSGYEFKLWTDRKAREFIADNYPDSLKNFDSYPYTIQKVDALRYFILYHYGGIYMDLDVGCLKPLDSLLSNDAIIPKTIPIGYSNDVLFASQRHPFYKQLIHALPYWNHYYLTPYPTIFFSTGPMFLTLQYFLYASTPGNTITVLPVEQYSGNDTGNSWHSWDAQFVFWLWGLVSRPWLIMLLITLFLMAFRQNRRRMSRAANWIARNFTRSEDDKIA